MNAVAKRRDINIWDGFQAYVIALLLGATKADLFSKRKDSFFLSHGKEMDEEGSFVKNQSLDNYCYLVPEEGRDRQVLQQLCLFYILCFFHHV